MVKEFNSLEEIQKYYEKGNNAYVFTENGDYIDLVILNFNLNVGANIEAWNINAWNIDCLNINANNINAYDIKARDISAWDIVASDINAGNIVAHDIYALSVNANNINAINIKANDISYHVVCFAYQNIKCKSIKGEMKNAKHFVLNGKLEVENQ